MEIREATANDAALIADFIKKLAEYERMSEQVVSDEESIRKSLFDEGAAKVIFAEQNGKAVGFALYFYNYSTFLGKKGLYLEDLFVLPEERGTGCGKALLLYLAGKAAEEGCGRMEWSCLNWNKPSIDFYLSVGAERMTDWTVFRLSGDALKRDAASRR